MKHWCVCWICGKNFSSIQITDDCGALDLQHKNAREGK